MFIRLVATASCRADRFTPLTDKTVQITEQDTAFEGRCLGLALLVPTVDHLGGLIQAVFKRFGSFQRTRCPEKITRQSNRLLGVKHDACTVITQAVFLGAIKGCLDVYFVALANTGIKLRLLNGNGFQGFIQQWLHFPGFFPVIGQVSLGIGIVRKFCVDRLQFYERHKHAFRRFIQLWHRI
ncbi:hypothetical protein D3C78_1069010 [compost metagenome]